MRQILRLENYFVCASIGYEYTHFPGVHYICFGYGDVPSGGYQFSLYWRKERYRFHNFGIRNGTNFRDFVMKYKVGYSFLKNWYKVTYTLWKIGIKSDIFSKN